MKIMREINGIVYVPQLGIIPGVSSDNYYKYIQKISDDKYVNNLDHGCYVKEIFDSSPLKLGDNAISYGDIILSINGYLIDNNGTCSVPWSDEKIHLNYVMYIQVK